MNETKLCYGCMEPCDEMICPNCGSRADVPVSPDYIAPGTVLHDRYLVGRLLGFNGEGATYVGLDHAIGCKVLIREYMPMGLCTRVKEKPTISVNYNQLAQYKALMAEYTELCKALAKLRNLNSLMPTLDLFSENNTTYTVYEYIEGIRLIDFLKDNAGELSWTRVKKLFPQLLTTISLVHNAGIIHRGISPDTIYVTAKGDLYLSAFCISGVRTAKTELQTELYPGYAAPEQYNASNRQGTWTDVYGICAVLYRLLTGCMPTSADSRLINDNLCPPHELNDLIPKHVSYAIMDGLKLNGDQRIQTVTELVTRLFDASNEQEATAAQPVAAPSPQPKRQQTSGAVNRQPRQQRVPIYDDAIENTDKDISAVDRIKIPFIIGILLLAIIMVIIIIVIYLFRGGGSGRIDQSMSMQSSSQQDSVISVEDTSETQATENFDSVMMNLLGKYYEVKKQELEGWINLEAEWDFNEEYPAGQIFWQEIEEGEGFQSGSTILVKVSRGSSTVNLPDFNGKTLEAYCAELDSLGVEHYQQVPLQTSYYQNGYVAKVVPDPSETLDLTGEYEVIVYYAQNVTTTATPATEAPETVETTVQQETAAATEAPATEAPATEAPVQGTEAPAVE